MSYYSRSTDTTGDFEWAIVCSIVAPPPPPPLSVVVLDTVIDALPPLVEPPYRPRLRRNDAPVRVPRQCRSALPRGPLRFDDPWRAR